MFITIRGRETATRNFNNFFAETLTKVTKKNYKRVIETPDYDIFMEEYAPFEANRFVEEVQKASIFVPKKEIRLRSHGGGNLESGVPVKGIAYLGDDMFAISTKKRLYLVYRVQLLF